MAWRLNFTREASWSSEESVAGQLRRLAFGGADCRDCCCRLLVVEEDPDWPGLEPELGVSGHWRCLGHNEGFQQSPGPPRHGNASLSSSVSVRRGRNVGIGVGGRLGRKEAWAGICQSDVLGTGRLRFGRCWSAKATFTISDFQFDGAEMTRAKAYK